MSRKVIISLGAVVAVVLVVVGGIIWYRRSSSIVPPVIRGQVGFAILLPNESKYKVDRSSFKYDANAKVLSVVVTQGSNHLTISEQAYPDILIYDKLIGTLNEYDELNTSAGQVALTHPKQFNGGQTAVVQTGDTLVFVHPDQNLTSQEWQEFFDELQPL